MLLTELPNGGAAYLADRKVATISRNGDTAKISRDMLQFITMITIPNINSYSRATRIEITVDKVFSIR